MIKCRVNGFYSSSVFGFGDNRPVFHLFELIVVNSLSLLYLFLPASFIVYSQQARLLCIVPRK